MTMASLGATGLSTIDCASAKKRTTKEKAKAKNRLIVMILL